MPRGRGFSPSLVIALCMGLPDDSLTFALMAGGRKHFGWGQDRHMLADLYDAINQNTRASGNWDKKGPPKIPLFPRPDTGDREAGEQIEKPKVSLRDLHAKFSRR